MPMILPFKGLRPAEGRADDVVAPPYDVMNAAEAREMAQGRPWSFLHISRPEIDLPDTDIVDPDGLVPTGPGAFVGNVWLTLDAAADGAADTTAAPDAWQRRTIAARFSPKCS